MNIAKLKKIHTGKKSHLKSFRLKNSANESLKLINKCTGLSENEIVNRMVEALGAECRLLEKIDNELKVNGEAIVTAYQTAIGYTLTFEVSKITNVIGQSILYKVKHTLSHVCKPNGVQENEIILEDIKDLLDFGFNSNYEIYRQQPKLKESE